MIVESSCRVTETPAIGFKIADIWRGKKSYRLILIRLGRQFIRCKPFNYNALIILKIQQVPVH